MQLVVYAAIFLMAASGCAAQRQPVKMDVNKFDEIAANHPAGAALERLFPQPAAKLPVDFSPTGLMKKDYLSLVAGNVDFWKQFQDSGGAILDPYDKDKSHPHGEEKQYSTPAFALASAELVKEAGREDLLDCSVRAFSFALTALEKGTTANQHADFYIPMLVHAHRILKDRVPANIEAKWEAQFKTFVPEKTYRDTGGNGNWNLVNVSGDAMRRKDGLVATTQQAKQQAYLDRCLHRQTQLHFSRFGMYEDMNEPLAYDAFPRLWLEDMTSDQAYDGPEREILEQTLALGSFSSLLIMSPQGEWACGGRSAQHQWNEAENAVIGECNAARWMARGRPDIAGAFKRMARMGLKSMKRWQRPSGELWIVKNFGEPAKRFGFEGYSFNSQYNLLPMAMLCIAYERADESIGERPLPPEYGNYLFDIRDPYRKVVAASGGYYALIETMSDPHYDATGLLRVHRRGVELSPLTGSSAPERVLGAAEHDPAAGLTPGVQWQEADGTWVGLGDYHRYEHPGKPKPTTAPATMSTTEPKGHKSKKEATSKPAPPATQPIVAKVELTDVALAEGSLPSVAFTLRYELERVKPRAVWPKDPKPEELRDILPGSKRVVTEQYTVSAEGVRRVDHVESAPAAQRFEFPAMVWDGARDIQPVAEDGKLVVHRAGGELTLVLTSPAGMKLTLVAPKLATHNGYVEAAVAPLAKADESVDWTVKLSPAPLPKLPAGPTTTK